MAIRALIFTHTQVQNLASSHSFLGGGRERQRVEYVNAEREVTEPSGRKSNQNEEHERKGEVIPERMTELLEAKVRYKKKYP